MHLQPDAHLIEWFFQDVVVDDGIMPRPRHLNVHRENKRVGPEVRSTAAVQYFPLTGSSQQGPPPHSFVCGDEGLENTVPFICDCLIIEYPLHIASARL